MMRILLVGLAVFACQREPAKDSAVPGKQYSVVEQWVMQTSPDNNFEMQFRNIGDIGLAPLPTSQEVKPTLIGGTPADPRDFPATVYSSQGNSRCTATIVGKRALLIAAHCVGNGKSAVFKAAGKDYSSSCVHHPDYRGNSTADWSLCKVSQDVVDVPFEIVNIDPAYYKVGDKILLTGFGCIRPNGSGGNDGVYRIGESPIIKVPSGTNYDIVTRGGAALCYGDSGGPAFKVDGAVRKQVSVNSRGNIQDTSYLSSVSAPTFITWATAWIPENSPICGISADATSCRGTDPGPGPAPLPPHCQIDLDKFANCLFGNPRGALTDAAGCQKAHADLFACEVTAERTE